MSDFKAVGATLKSLSRFITSGYKRQARTSSLRVLRTQIWLKSLLRDLQLSESDFKKELFRERESTGSVERWRNGEQIVSPSMVKRLASLSATSAAIYQLAVFDLLEPDIKKAWLTKLFRKHTASDPFKRWEFKDVEPFRLSTTQKSQLILLNDSDRLYHLGGVYGFIGILMLLRQAELKGDALRHFLLLQDAYRAFPGFCKNPYFQDHWEALLDALVVIHGNLTTSLMLVRPRTDVLKHRVEFDEQPASESSTERLLMDGRTADQEEPFELAVFPGD